jgi:hypothetical protein
MPAMAVRLGKESAFYGIGRWKLAGFGASMTYGNRLNFIDKTTLIS